MKWLNLKENKCPQCNKDFTKGYWTTFNSRAFGKPEVVINHECGFKIREKRYSQIVTSQITQKLEAELKEEYANQGSAEQS